MNTRQAQICCRFGKTSVRLLFFKALLAGMGFHLIIGELPSVTDAETEVASCSAISLCWVISSPRSIIGLSQVKVLLDGNEFMTTHQRRRAGSLQLMLNAKYMLSYEKGRKRDVYSISASCPPTVRNVLQRTQVNRVHPSNRTSELLKQIYEDGHINVCEKEPVYVVDERDMILLVGYTERFPVKLEARTFSTLLLSWKGSYSADEHYLHSILLLDVRNILLWENTTDKTSYEIVGLMPCHKYRVCVSLANYPSIICLTTLTDPEKPTNFSIIRSESSSIIVYWDGPLHGGFSWFNLTVLLYNPSLDIFVPMEQPFEYPDHSMEVKVDNLPPCSKVRFNLETICDAGEITHSEKIYLDGSTGASELDTLRQTSATSGSFTLQWTAKSPHSQIIYRVYSNNVLKRSTNQTFYTVTNLTPCSTYTARVEAFCRTGETTENSIEAWTGPGAVSHLYFDQLQAKAFWKTRSGPRVTFRFRLFDDMHNIVKNGSRNHPQLYLHNLRPGSFYELEVQETCFKLEGHSSFLEFHTEETDPSLFEDDQKHVSLEPSFSLMLPWALPDYLQEASSKSRELFEKYTEKQLENIFSSYKNASRVDINLEDFTKREDKTEINFQVRVFFDNASSILSDVEEWEHIKSLNLPYISDLKNGTLYWNDTDECASFQLNNCDDNSHCINTLDSFACVCQDGFYGVKDPTKPDEKEICDGSGMYVHCELDLMKVAVSKEFVREHVTEDASLMLNDGSCPLQEAEKYFFFIVQETDTYCGALIKGNDTHVVFEHTLHADVRMGQMITRSDLMMIWRCIFPRNYLLHTFIGQVQNDRPVSVIVIEHNTTEILKLSMTLYKRSTFDPDYFNMGEINYLPSSDLFFEVKLLSTQETLAKDFILAVVSCWATETNNPHDERKVVFLNESCPLDETFRWYSINGIQQWTRFAVQMFSITRNKPIYVHCWTEICTTKRKQKCTRECVKRENKRKRESHKGMFQQVNTILSVGPIIVPDQEHATDESKTWISFWAQYENVLAFVAIVAGILLSIILGIILLKAIIRSKER
uniref:Uncharacterized LOC114664278 n=1 Tax=Erpetoichthys calabaricus TaxID=27687 RepID=A0A8C4RL28_ERPCA